MINKNGLLFPVSRFLFVHHGSELTFLFKDSAIKSDGTEEQNHGANNGNDSDECYISKRHIHRIVQRSNK